MADQVRVKICGLKTADHIQAAADAGAAYVGLVFFEKSPRNISLERAAELASGAPVGLAGHRTKTAQQVAVELLFNRVIQIGCEQTGVCTVILQVRTLPAAVKTDTLQIRNCVEASFFG